MKTPSSSGKYRVTFYDDSEEVRVWWCGLWWSKAGHSMPLPFIKSWEAI